MEIGGFDTAKGFVKLNPPLRVKVSDIPVVDGAFDWDYSPKGCMSTVKPPQERQQDHPKTGYRIFR